MRSNLSVNEQLPRIRVDFNELIGSDLVLLAKSDIVECNDGHQLTLYPGMNVIAFEYNIYADSTTECLFVQGKVERNDPAINGEWTRNALWCCRFADKVQSSDSMV